MRFRKLAALVLILTSLAACVGGLRSGDADGESGEAALAESSEHAESPANARPVQAHGVPDFSKLRVQVRIHLGANHQRDCLVESVVAYHLDVFDDYCSGESLDSAFRIAPLPRPIAVLGLYPGEYQLEAHVTCFGLYFRVPCGSLMVAAGDAPLEHTIELADISPPIVNRGRSQLTGRAYDSDGNPVPGVRVTARTDAEESTRYRAVYHDSARQSEFAETWLKDYELLRTTITDHEGRWTLPYMPDAEDIEYGIDLTYEVKEPDRTLRLQRSVVSELDGPTPLVTSLDSTRRMRIGERLVTTYAPIAQVSIGIQFENVPDGQAGSRWRDHGGGSFTDVKRVNPDGSLQQYRIGQIAWERRRPRELVFGEYRMSFGMWSQRDHLVWQGLSIDAKGTLDLQRFDFTVPRPTVVRVTPVLPAMLVGAKYDLRIVPVESAQPYALLSSPFVPAEGRDFEGAFSLYTTARGAHRIELLLGSIIVSSVEVDVPENMAVYHVNAAFPEPNLDIGMTLEFQNEAGEIVNDLDLQLSEVWAPSNEALGNPEHLSISALRLEDGTYWLPWFTTDFRAYQRAIAVHFSHAKNGYWQSSVEGLIGKRNRLTIHQPTTLSLKLLDLPQKSDSFSASITLTLAEDRSQLITRDNSGDFRLLGNMYSVRDASLFLGGIKPGEYFLTTFNSNRFTGASNYHVLDSRPITLQSGDNEIQFAVPKQHQIKVDVSAIGGLGQLNMWRLGWPRLSREHHTGLGETPIDFGPTSEGRVIFTWIHEEWRDGYRLQAFDEPQRIQEPRSDARIMTFANRDCIDREIPASLIVDINTDTQIVFPKTPANALVVLIEQEDSPATECGLYDGDIVLTMDGRSLFGTPTHAEFAALAEGIDLAKWREMAKNPDHIHRLPPMLPPNSKRTLTLRRGHHIITITCPAHGIFDGLSAAIVPIKVPAEWSVSEQE